MDDSDYSWIENGHVRNPFGEERGKRQFIDLSEHTAKAIPCNLSKS